ncbi:hypothetical protein RclHR1_01720003 [Rhizophagus clarus]|nr:hypothetical protein RclHR1_01720003 [Rhizophagus clarus]
MQEIEHFSTSPKAKSVSFVTQDDGQSEEIKYRIKHDLDYKSAKKLIKKALFEFYRGVLLLKNYIILNKTGFVKILKKYDKITDRNGSEIFLPRISNYNFAKSAPIDNLIKETETFYINNFEQGIRSQAMKNLRLPPRKENLYYFVTWRVGLYIGLSIPILVRAIELAFRNKPSFDPLKWPVLLQIYCAYFIPIVFALLFGINMHTWTKARINYKFIFEFDPRNNLNYKQYFEIPAFMLLVFSYTTYIGFNFTKFEHCVWILGIILSCILLCPFKIFYYDARRWFIIALLRVVASGFYRVEFRDFFIADELNSLTYTFMNTQYLFCAIKACRFSLISPLLTTLPPWWRFVQCLKRYSLTYHKYPHLLNAGKYFSTIMAIWFLFLFRTYNNKITKSFWIGGQTISSTYSFLWDVLMDWSLLQLDSQNYLLRDELNFKNHAIYYFAIVSDGLLRFSWILQLIIPSKYSLATIFTIAFGEMLRRWQWNFFRVENEHVNNCGQFRAIKEIPLPFEKETLDEELNEENEPQEIKLSSRITNAYLPQRRAGLPHKIDDIQRWRDFQPNSNAVSYAYSDVTDDEQLSEPDSLDDPKEISFPPLRDEYRNNNECYDDASNVAGTSTIPN